MSYYSVISGISTEGNEEIFGHGKWMGHSRVRVSSDWHIRPQGIFAKYMKPSRYGPEKHSFSTSMHWQVTPDLRPCVQDPVTGLRYVKTRWETFLRFGQGRRKSMQRQWPLQGMLFTDTRQPFYLKKKEKIGKEEESQSPESILIGEFICIF